jgi:hypothetical protein
MRARFKVKDSEGLFKALSHYELRRKGKARHFATRSSATACLAFKSGSIGGDLGGYYTIYWESPPFKRNGKEIKLRGKTQMLSPAHYRLLLEISVEGGPYTSLGNPWFRKMDAKPTG